jgi:hypothetical protein
MSPLLGLLKKNQVNHRKGTKTRDGNSTSKNNTASSAHKKGHKPFMSSFIEILETPQMTFSTIPTGGVMSPMALFMMNSTPK